VGIPALCTHRRQELVKTRARTIERDVIALWLVARDPRTPWYPKLLAFFVAAYALVNASFSTEYA
jgi:uncharacterized membrane protein YkvA (DUF1232 family)